MQLIRFYFILYLLCFPWATNAYAEQSNNAQVKPAQTTYSQNSIASNTQIKLPDLSSTADLSISKAEKEKIRQKIINQLRKSTNLIEDPELSYYIRQLGLKLLEQTDYAYKNFDFFLFNSPQINAFATPGGVIVLYTGLLIATETESELASVIAHEIAHVTHQHIARTIEEAQGMNVPMTLAVIAAILLGAQTSADVGIASITGLNAFQAQQQINFTRAHEIEADSIGINTLHMAGFNPYGMAGFFQKLQQNNQYSGAELPEFLRTHPITVNRLSDARNKAQSLTKLVNKSVYQVDFYYRLMRVRADIISHANQQPLSEKYQLLMNQHSIDKNPEYFYAYALTLEENQKYNQALNIYNKLIKQYPKELTYTIAMARSLGNSENIKQQEKALALLKNALTKEPYHPVINYYYAKLLNKTHHYQQSVDTLNHFLNYADKQAVYYQLLSNAYHGLKQKTLSAIALADYYTFNKEYLAAKNQLDIANKNSLDDYQQSIIHSKLKNLEKYLDKKND